MMTLNGLQHQAADHSFNRGYMKRFGRNTSGATAIEYALIGALIIIAVVASFTILGSSSNGLWANINANVSSKL